MCVLSFQADYGAQLDCNHGNALTLAVLKGSKDAAACLFDLSKNISCSCHVLSPIILNALLKSRPNSSVIILNSAILTVGT